MRKETSLEILKQNLADLQEVNKWLVHSYQICERLRDKSNLKVPEYDAIESFLSRYARICDLLLRKAFRSIDAFELERSGTMLDVLNRAEKRGLIDSSEQAREWTELRNQIVHDYAHHDFHSIFHDALDFIPQILTALKKTQRYCEKILS